VLAIVPLLALVIPIVLLLPLAKPGEAVLSVGVVTFLLVQTVLQIVAYALFAALSSRIFQALAGRVLRARHP
jgi:hypothetical protein